MASIPGLNTAITKETLIASATLHNEYPPDAPFPQVDELSDGFQELCVIIAKHGLETCIQLRLLHRHLSIPEGQILLGRSITKPRGWWTELTNLVDVDTQKIHGHIFSVTTTDYKVGSEGSERRALMLPSEFREGPPVNLDKLSHDFFVDFIDCLKERGLEKVLGIEVLQAQATSLVEFSFTKGNILVQKEEVRRDAAERMTGQNMFRVTGWGITVDNEVVKQTGKTECVIYAPPLGHQRVEAKDALRVVETLRNEGILVLDVSLQS